jgi:hypothetical protein
MLANRLTGNKKRDSAYAQKDGFVKGLTVMHGYESAKTMSDPANQIALPLITIQLKSIQENL